MRDVRPVGVLAAMLILVSSTCAAFAGEYRLDTGDKVRIRVQEWPDVSGEFVIGADGTVPVATAGPVEARGLTPLELAAAIGQRLVKRPGGASGGPMTVVDVVRYRSIFVLGDVQKPGEYEYQPNLTITKAISLAGGFYRPPTAGFQRFERDAIQAQGDAQTWQQKAMRLRVLIARLKAELDNAAALDLPPEISRQRTDETAALVADAEAALASSRRMLADRAQATESAKALLREEIQSLTQQIAAEGRQHDYVRRELDKMKDLAERGLASSPRMLELERVSAQITGARQALETSIVRARQEMQKLDQKLAELRDEAMQRARLELQKAELDLDEALGKQRTAIELAQEAETLGPAQLLKLDAAKPLYAFRIIRARVAGDGHDEIDSHRHAEVQPGDVVEISKSGSAAEGSARAAAALR